MPRTPTVLFFFTIMALSFLSCRNSATKQPDTNTGNETPSTSAVLIFDRLPGTWQSENGSIFERWVKNGDGTYESRVFSLAGDDTAWKETARIFPEDKHWVFENIVKGQNEGKATRFTSTILNDSSVQFSNPAHDFPTDINYTIVDDTTLNAFIIGPGSGDKRDTVWFKYRKRE